MPPTDSTTRALEARRARGIQIAVTLAVLIAVLRVTPLTRDLFIFPLVETPAYDALFDHARPEPPADIVIVDVDDRSLRELGRFQSWHRDRYAELLERLGEARVVAFDILFPEPDDAPAQGSAGDSPLTADEVFAAAMRRHGRVVLAAHWQPQAAADPLHRDLAARFAYPHAAGRLKRSGQGEVLALPTPELADAAAAVGFVDVDPDRDGVYRRFRPLVIGPDRLVFPHFGVAVAAATGDTDGAGIMQDVERHRYGLAEPGRPRLFIDPGGTTLINYSGPTGTVPRVSFVDALRDPATADLLRGKVVIVGATAPGLYDIRPAPYRAQNRLFFGVETNANVVAGLLHRRPLRDASGSYAWCALALLLGLTAGIAVWMRGAAGWVSAGVLFPVALCSFWIAFRLWGVWVPYGALLLGTTLPLAWGVYERLTMERRLIQRQFDAYVSPDVLRELMDAPELIHDSRRRAVTLLFADVRGSTTLSETIPPEVWVAQLNEYLTQMSRAMFSYDGYLDKFMGDGIMAVWNAFGTQEDNHAELAVRAGRQMLQRLDLLNRKWEQTPDRTPLRIGIGIHTGEAVMGNVGSEERTQYTAIGDTVNTAARIEGMTKQHHCELIISGTTARLIGDMFPLRELGEAEVRGRAGKVAILEVLSEPAASQQRREENSHGAMGEEEAE